MRGGIALRVPRSWR